MVLALASRACNHRVRSHLSANCKTTNAVSWFFERPERWLDALLGYTRTLAIRYDTNPTTIPVILCRFTLPPLVPMNFLSTCISEGLPKMPESDLHNFYHVTVTYCTPDPFILINLVSAIEHVDGLRLQGCGVTTPSEGHDNLPSLTKSLIHIRIALSPFQHN